MFPITSETWPEFYYILMIFCKITAKMICSSIPKLMTCVKIYKIRLSTLNQRHQCERANKQRGKTIMGKLLVSDAISSWLKEHRSLEKRQQQQRLMMVIAERWLTHYIYHPSVSNEASCVLHSLHIHTASAEMTTHHTWTFRPAILPVPSGTLNLVSAKWG